MGPGVGKPPEMSLQLFFMAAFDQDRFRRFVLSPAFKNNYELDDETYDKIANDDIDCMYFGFRLLRQVLFNEKTIAEIDGALDKRVEERKEVIEMRRKMEIDKARQNDPYQAYRQEVEAEDNKKDDQ